MSIRSSCLGIRRICTVALVAVLPAVMGCDYNVQTQGSYLAYTHGDLEQAAQTAQDQAEKAQSNDQNHDKLLLTLEDGAIQRAASHLDVSQRALDRADEIYSVFEVGPNIRISQQTAAVAVNDTVMDYTGYAYDGIMLNTYKALDAMELGDLDRMRVELNHASQRQTDAVIKFKKQISEAQGNQQDQNSQFDLDSARSDPQFQQNYNQQYADLNVEDLSSYTDYVNPFTEYLRGLYFMYAGEDSSDLEQGATAMRRVAGLIKGNTYVEQDAVLADQIANGQKAPPTTYVIYEAGLAPERGQIKIGFPLVLRGGQRGGTYQLIEAAFPTLVKLPCEADDISVQAGGTSYPTALVCDMDKVIEQEFKSELPGVVARTMISTALKAIAQYAADRAAANSGNSFVNALVQVGTNVYVHAAAEADRRTWKTLPKEFCIARLPTPPDRNITLTFPSGLAIPVHVQDGVINVVTVKYIDDGVPPIVRQSKLK